MQSFNPLIILSQITGHLYNEKQKLMEGIGGMELKRINTVGFNARHNAIIFKLKNSSITIILTAIGIESIIN